MDAPKIIYKDLNPNVAGVALALKALRAIVTETMDSPPTQPYSGDSYLPPHLIAQAQRVLAYFDLDINSSSQPSTDGCRTGAAISRQSIGTDHSRPLGLSAVDLAESA